MEEKPCTAVTAEAQNFLEPQGADAGLLNRDPPDCIEPSLEAEAAGFEDRSRLNRVLKTAALATSQPRGESPIFGTTAGLTLKAGTPTHFLEKTKACFVARENSVKVFEVLWVLQTSYIAAHQAGPVKCICRYSNYWRVQVRSPSMIHRPAVWSSPSWSVILTARIE